MYKAQNFKDLFLSDSAAASSARMAIGKAAEKHLADSLGDDAEIEAALNGHYSPLAADMTAYLSYLYQASVEFDGPKEEDLQDRLMDMQRSMNPTSLEDRKRRHSEYLMSLTHKERAALYDLADWMSL